MVGLTLIELVITISVAAILLAVAAPSFSEIIKNNRMTTQLNELVAGLNVARSEAIKRADFVTVCMSSDSTTCTGNWSDGWIVFPDFNNDGVVSAGETVFRVYAAPSTSAILSSTVNLNDRITFDSEGRSVGYDGRYLLCDDRGDSNKKGLVTSNTGQVRTAQSSDLQSINC